MPQIIKRVLCFQLPVPALSSRQYIISRDCEMYEDFLSYLSDCCLSPLLRHKDTFVRRDRTCRVSSYPPHSRSRAERPGLQSPVAGVLDEPFSRVTSLSGVAVQARLSTQAGTVSILCGLAGRYGYSDELAQLSKVRLKLPLLHTGRILQGQEAQRGMDIYIFKVTMS